MADLQDRERVTEIPERWQTDKPLLARLLERGLELESTVSFLHHRLMENGWNLAAPMPDGYDDYWRVFRPVVNGSMGTYGERFLRFEDALAYIIDNDLAKVGDDA